MESEKVRVIDKKGEARFVMPHIANDKKLMRNYGFTIQDLKVKGEVKNEITEPALSETANTEDLEPLDLLAQPEKAKRGRKPNVKK